MTRSIRCLILLFPTACTVGPRFVGETAETGGTDDSSQTGDGGDEMPTSNAADESSTGVSCSTDCGGSVAWVATFDRHPVGVSFPTEHDARVYTALLGDVAEPDARTYDDAGVAIGAAETLGLPPSHVLALRTRDDILAVVQGVGDDQFYSYRIDRLPIDLSTISWTTQYEPATPDAPMLAHDVWIAPDGVVHVSGSEDLDGDERIAVHAYSPGGVPLWTWRDSSAFAALLAPVFIGDPSEHDLVIWAHSHTSSDESTARMVAIDASGDEVTRKDLSFAGISLAKPVHVTSGWRVAGLREPEGSVWQATIDHAFQLADEVDDDELVDGQTMRPSELVTREDDLVVVGFELNDDPRLQVRRYDDAGALIDAFALPPATNGEPLLGDAALAPDGDVVVWGSDLSGGAPPTGWLMRIVL
jgi:hypothetical protein